MNILPTILILGETGHGKDELCNLLVEHFGYSFTPASRLACDMFVFDELKEQLGYTSAEECYNDRRNQIPSWVETIAEFNTPDKAALAKEVMKTSNIYCGIRKRDEFNAALAEGLFDCIVWVDATKRVPALEQSYVELTSDDAHFIVDNNGDLKQLIQRAKRVHARAMQMAAAKPTSYNDQGTTIVDRSDLAKATPEETEALITSIDLAASDSEKTVVVEQFEQSLQFVKDAPVAAPERPPVAPRPIKLKKKKS